MPGWVHAGVGAQPTPAAAAPALRLVAAMPATLTLRQAHLVATAAGQPDVSMALELPLHWDVAFAGRSGKAELLMKFDAPAGSERSREPYALFITRLGNAYEIELNGVILSAAGNLLGPADGWSAKQPVFLSFPARLLKARNELRIRLRADAGYRAGLSELTLGPASVLAPMARHVGNQRVLLAQAAAVFSLMVAFFCGLLWWQHRDPLTAWAALGGALWSVVVADTFVEATWLPWPYWGVSLLLLRALWSWALYATAQAVFGQRPQGERRAMMTAHVALPLFVAAMVAGQSAAALQLWYAIALVLWAWVIARLSRQVWRTPSSVGVLMVLALLAVLVSSLRDVTAGHWAAELYGEPAWATYAAMLMGMVLIGIVGRRFAAARADVARLNRSLAHEVDVTGRDLRASLERLHDLERATAAQAERERILRTTHDDVSANLAAAVRQLEGGRAASRLIVQTLRESMDQLELSTDALDLPPGDVNALLASLRYRLQPRIESAGIQLEWHVGELPRWPAGNDESMGHLLFLLLQVISHVLKHPHASAVSMRADAREGELRITVTDNGGGLRDVAVGELRSLDRRAKAIGAEVSVEAAQPGTRVIVVLPGIAPAACG